MRWSSRRQGPASQGTRFVNKCTGEQVDGSPTPADRRPVHPYTCSPVHESVLAGRCQGGWTLPELVLVLVIAGVLFALVPPIILFGVRTLVFVPKAVATDHVAAEVMQQLIEGGFSTLPGQADPIRGLRFAIRRVPLGGTGLQPALWLTEDVRVGYVSSDGQLVLVRLNTINAALARALVPAGTTCASVPAGPTEELVPYDALGSARVLASGPMFQYRNQAGALLTPACPPDPAIRRVDVAMVVQTGNGVFEAGQASQSMRSSVAIRIP